jgi:hypothetical protein
LDIFLNLILVIDLQRIQWLRAIQNSNNFNPNVIITIAAIENMQNSEAKYETKYQT